MNQRQAQFINAIKNLKDSLSSEVITPRDEAGAIKLFELTYELSWKVLKKHLEDKEGVITKSPRDAINEAYRVGLIKNETLWLEIIRVRNVSAHVYDEEGMEPVIKKLPGFLKEFEGLCERLNT